SSDPGAVAGEERDVRRSGPPGIHDGRPREEVVQGAMVAAQNDEHEAKPEHQKAQRKHEHTENRPRRRQIGAVGTNGAETNDGHGLSGYGSDTRRAAPAGPSW